jgi:hypothetical protein
VSVHEDSVHTDARRQGGRDEAATGRPSWRIGAGCDDEASLSVGVRLLPSFVAPWAWAR